MKPTIGILGGMGPRATIQFEKTLLDRILGSDQQLPTIITINDGSIPDRTDYLVNGGEDPVPSLSANLRILEQLGASVICIPCNTACVPLIFDRLQSTTSELLNLPEQVCKFITLKKVESVFLLATEGTVDSGVYQNLCIKVGVKCLIPNEYIQQKVTKIIRLVKHGNFGPANQLSKEVAGVIEASGSEGAILGCTELSLVSDQILPRNCLMIDTINILADACVDYVKVA